MILNLWKGYLRWRHSKGYGVHSPYAYRFITEVLHPGKYGYYAYNQLESLSRGLIKGNPSIIRNAKFLIRLLIFLHSKRIITLGEKYPAAQLAAKALKLVYFNCESGSKVTYKTGDLLVITSPKDIDLYLVENAIEHNVPMFAFNPSHELRRVLSAPIESGVLFTGISKMLLIPRPEMQYVSYEIRW